MTTRSKTRMTIQFFDQDGGMKALWEERHDADERPAGLLLVPERAGLRVDGVVQKGSWREQSFTVVLDGAVLASGVDGWEDGYSSHYVINLSPTEAGRPFFSYPPA